MAGGKADEARLTLEALFLAGLGKASARTARPLTNITSSLPQPTTSSSITCIIDKDTCSHPSWSLLWM